MSEAKGMSVPSESSSKGTQVTSARRPCGSLRADCSTMITLTVSLIPFLYTIYLTFHKMPMHRWELFRDLQITGIAGNSAFWHSVWVTTLFVAIAVPIEFSLGLAGALLLHQKIRLRQAVVPLLFIPTMMAPVVVAILWKIMLAGPGVCCLTMCLSDLALSRRFQPLLRRTSPSTPSSSWTSGNGLLYDLGLLCRTSIASAHPYRAAAVDGATPVQTFFRLTIR